MARIAKIKDVPAIVRLVNIWAGKGEMLGRSQAQIYNAIRDFVVIERDGEIVGCGALHVVWEDIGEIRTLAIAPDRVGEGFGKKIVKHLLNDAKKLEH